MTSIAGAELILQQLTTGDGEPVLVADFQAFSTAPRLSQLLGGRTEGAVYQVDPVSILSQEQRYLSLSKLAAASVDAFLSSLPANGHVFVVGHCSAAPLALRIAEMLECSRRVTAILVQPTWPDEEHIRVRFAEFQAKLGAASRPCPDLDGDPCHAVAQMEQILSDGLAALASRNGLGGSIEAFSDLLAWYRGWLAFLLACRNDPPTARATEMVSVKVLTDVPACVTVPGLGPDAYQISRLPTLDQATPVPPELADFVITQLASRLASIYRRNSDACLGVLAAGLIILVVSGRDFPAAGLFCGLSGCSAEGPGLAA
jgi:hypothetical protein